MVTAADLGLKEGIRVFESGGHYYWQLMLRLCKNHVPFGPSDLMDLISEGVGTPYETARRSIFFSTSVGFVEFESELLVDKGVFLHLDPNTKLIHRDLIPYASPPIIQSSRDSGYVTAYSMSDLSHFLNRGLAEEDLRRDTPIHRLWLDLANGSEARLDQYVTNVFRFGKDSLNRDAMMALCIPSGAYGYLGYLRFREFGDADTVDPVSLGARLIGSKKNLKNSF